MDELREIQDDISEVKSGVSALTATLVVVERSIAAALDRLTLETDRLRERYHSLANQEQAVEALKRACQDHEIRIRELERIVVPRVEIDLMKGLLSQQAGGWIWVRNVGSAGALLALMVGGLWWLFERLPPAHP